MNLPPEFLPSLIIILVVGVIAGIVKCVYEEVKGFSKISKNLVVGGASAFMIWMFNDLTDSATGQILLAFIAGWIGIYALAEIPMMQRYISERNELAETVNKLAKTVSEEIDWMEELRQRDDRIAELEKQMGVAGKEITCLVDGGQVQNTPSEVTEQKGFIAGGYEQ